MRGALPWKRSSESGRRRMVVVARSEILSDRAGAESVPVCIDPEQGPRGAKPARRANSRNSARAKIIRRFPARPEISVPILFPRTRAISVRLSEEEHAALEKFCLEGGARCISDVARDAIRSFVSQASEEGTLLASLMQHSDQVEELKQRLELLAVEFATLKAGMQPSLPLDTAGVSAKNPKPGESASLTKAETKRKTAGRS